MRLFNSEFEVSMRVLLLLNVFHSSLDIDRIMYLDFFTIFLKTTLLVVRTSMETAITASIV